MAFAKIPSHFNSAISAASACLLLLLGAVPAFAALKKEADVPYGPAESQKLDIWWDDSNTHAPIVYLVHGGGWRSGDKSGYSNQTLAEWVTRKGCILVSPGAIY